MTKIMQTLWDESSDLTDEAMASDASVLSNTIQQVILKALRKQ